MYANILFAAIFVCVVAGSYVQGRADGNRITKAEYIQRDLQSSEEARIAERGIAARERAKESDWQKRFAQASTKYQRSIDASATALVTANAVRLFDPGRPIQTPANGTGKVASNSVATDTRGTELSATFADFLKREASRADTTAMRLNLCIDVLESERI